MKDQGLLALSIGGNTGGAFLEVKNGICFVYIEVTPYSVAHDIPICWTLPAPITPGLKTFSLGTNGGRSYPSYLGSDNALRLYYPAYGTIERIDATISYPVAL